MVARPLRMQPHGSPVWGKRGRHTLMIAIGRPSAVAALHTWSLERAPGEASQANYRCCERHNGTDCADILRQSHGYWPEMPDK
jgi:hypothetical protein